MKRLACRYTLVQFMPYAETGEFANVGVVLACPETGFFDFKLETQRHKRITDFFSPLASATYRNAIQVMNEELARIASVVRELPFSTQRADTIRHMMTALTHPREAMLRFSQARPILTPDPIQQIEQLFEHYVRHSFVTREYLEETMTKRIENLLVDLNLPAPFKKIQIQLEDTEVRIEFPLGQRLNGEISKLIKPFDLSQNTPNQIFEHGDRWVQKMRRLRRRNLLDCPVLFAVAAPPKDQIKRFNAYQDICAELKITEIQVVQQDQESEITNFAKSY